jgi:acetyl esterase/lipase
VNQLLPLNDKTVYETTLLNWNNIRGYGSVCFYVHKLMFYEILCFGSLTKMHFNINNLWRKPVRKIIVLLTVLFAACSVMSAEPDQKIVYKETPTKTLELHIYNPEGHKASDKTPAIVFFYGGGWYGGKIGQFYRQSEHLASRGMVAICADYRTKNFGGVDPRGCVADAKSAMRYVRSHAEELGIDPDRIAAGGGSAGGHLAAASALIDQFDEEGEDTSVSCQPGALVLFNPVVDNGEGGYGYERVYEYWQDFSPLHNIDKDAPPTLFMLGTEDKLIPVSVGEEYKSKMEDVGVRCELRLYDGQGHGFFNGARYDQTLQEADDFLTSLGYLPKK